MKHLRAMQKLEGNGWNLTKIPVMEVFGPTIQGEGMVIGQKTMFVRTAGCDHTPLPEQKSLKSTTLKYILVQNQLFISIMVRVLPSRGTYQKLLRTWV